MHFFNSNAVLFLAFLLSGISFTAFGVRVLDLWENSKKDIYVGAHRFDCNLNPLRPFTSCIRFQFQKLIRTNMLMQLDASSGRPQLQMQIDVSRLRIAVAQEFKFIFLEQWLKPHKWYLFCVMNDPSLDKGLSIYLNGKKLSSDKVKLKLKSESGNLTIGYVNPDIYPEIKFIGNVTQFNVWTKLLSENELEDIALCRKDLEGNLIKWSDDGWTYDQPVIEYNLNLTDLCEPETELETHLFPLMNFYEASNICEGIGGELVTPTNTSYGQEIFTWARTNYLGRMCGLYWVGVWDDGHEGLWTFHRDGKLAMNLSWAPDEPNGIQFENCGGLDFEGLIDDNCNTLRCPFCAAPPTTYWTMFGSCEDNAYNTLFSLEIDFDEWTFRGYGEYVIERNNASWIWKNSETNTTLATLHDGYKYNYPIGRKNWTIHCPFCQQTNGIRLLLLTTCRKGQFTCDDGTCIKHKYRCDLKYDCRDNSDEVNCNIIRFPTGYKGDLSPREGDFLDNGSPLQVSVDLSIETLRVEVNNMLLEVSFNLSLSWLDSRVMYTNLKEDLSLNVIPTNSQLWSPSISFANTKDNAGTEKSDQTSFYVIKRKESREKDSATPEEVTLFLGSENPIVSHRKYQNSFTCDFDLVSYPFDSQMCNMDLILRLRTSDILVFDSDRMTSTYKGKTLLLEYEVGTVEIEPYEYGVYSGLKVMIPLRRLHGYAYINIYLPTITMLVIGYLTLFFKIDIFEVRIMTALTTLLVMATLFTQVASSLPKTSYFKMVDIWFLFCINSIFFVIAFHIIIALAIPGPSHNIENSIHPSSSEGTKEQDTEGIASEKPQKTSRFRKCLKLPRSPKGIQIFAQIFMAVIFFAFNFIYWMTIYFVRQ